MFDESTEEPTTQPDTENHTKFHADDPDADFEQKSRLDGTATFEQHFARLASHNAGIYNGKWADKTKLRQQDNLAVFDAVAGQLSLTSYQKKVGRREFQRLNLSELSSPVGIDTTLLAIMVAAVVARRDGRGYHPVKADTDNDGLFLSFLSRFDYCDSVVHSAFGKVRHRLEGSA